MLAWIWLDLSCLIHLFQPSLFDAMISQVQVVVGVEKHDCNRNVILKWQYAVILFLD